MKMNDQVQLPKELIQMNLYIENMKLESDRGAVLSIAAALEDRLKEIILHFLKNVTSSEALFESYNAPIGTFSSKILFAHALGLISDNEYKELETLRKMRNEFAHTWENITLESTKIKGKLKNLPVLGLSPEERKTPRACFNNWSAVFLARLLYRNEVSKKHRLQDLEFDNLAKVIDNYPELL